MKEEFSTQEVKAELTEDVRKSERGSETIKKNESKKNNLKK